MKRRLRDLQESCCAISRNVLETYAEAFGLREDLFLGVGSADSPEVSFA